MEVNELRVGNLYVNYEDKICPWGCDDFAMLWKNQGLEVDELIRNFIQLTDEWLLKFGFVEEFENKFYKNSIAIEIFENECIVYLGDFVDLSIKYVHQIQNLYFAMTGEELAIA